MTSHDNSSTHKTWQDAVGIGLGVLAALSPWIMQQGDNSQIVMATAIAGVVVLILSAVQLLILNREQEIVTLGCGLWLVASPFVLGYFGTPLAFAHLLLGAAIAVLSALELRQDWNMSEVSIGLFGSSTTPRT